MKCDAMGSHRRSYLLISLFTVAVLFAFIVYIAWDNHRFTVTFYQIPSSKTDRKVRIVDLSDLHNASFGPNNEGLTRQIRELAPDFIVMTGDMVTAGNEDMTVITDLCADLIKIAPIYYTFGNHENEMVFGSDVTEEFLEKQAEQTGMQEYGRLDYEKMVPADARLPDALNELGVIVLNNNAITVSRSDVSVDLIGVDNQSGTFFPYSSTVVGEALLNNPEHIKVILAHQPSIWEALACLDIFSYDVLLSGHKHGGIIRMPGLGGMFCEGALWPWFTGNGKEAGMFTTGQGTVIVSRGLGNSSFLPRINNTPELVVIDIGKEVASK